MLGDIESNDDAIKLAVWASQLTFLIHPYYDGNGRVSRAVFTFALEKTSQPPICLENPRKSASDRALPFLFNLSLKLVLGLYAKNTEALPSYIPLSRNVITPADILGIPSYAPFEEMTSQKLDSLERLLVEHLEGVSMEGVRELFTQEDVEAYKDNAQPMLG